MLSDSKETQNKVKGVIVITDNRLSGTDKQSKLFQQSPFDKFRNSAFKATDIDPAEDRNDYLFCEEHFDFTYLNEKVDQLEKRLEALEKKTIHRMDSPHKELNTPQEERKKRRRKFQQISRNETCPYSQCGKTYGSQTALRKHIKLKHQTDNSE